MAKKRKRSEGRSRMAALGKRPVEIWLNEEEMLALEEACQIKGKRRTYIVKTGGMALACAIIEQRDEEMARG